MVTGYQIIPLLHSQSVKSYAGSQHTQWHYISVHFLCWDCWRFLATDWISSFIPKRTHTAGTKVIAVNCSMHHTKGLATIWMIKPCCLKIIVFYAQAVRYLSWKSQTVKLLAVVYRVKPFNYNLWQDTCQRTAT